MRVVARSLSISTLVGLLAGAVLVGCAPADSETASAAGTPVTALEKGGQEEFGPYEVVANWPQPLPDHDGWTWGSSGAVYAESPDRIWVAQRGELPLPPDAKPFTPYGMLSPPQRATGGENRYHHVLFVLNRDGQVVQWWEQHDKLFAQPGGRGPHRIKMSPYDPEKHVWVVDDNLHAIFKFSYDGELVMTLGEVGVEGRGPNNFARPTDIAWLPDGTFFISDGYDGTRVAKFDAEGNFLMDWGMSPADPDNPGPNEFDTVHSVAVSQDRRVFVVDRSHRRMQVFDENGQFLDMFGTGMWSSPHSHMITADQALWVSDGGTQRILKYDLDGHYMYGWGVRGGQAGQFDGPRQMSVDQEGNLYIAEVFNGRVQMFRPKPNADPARLIGQEVRVATTTTND